MSAILPLPAGEAGKAWRSPAAFDARVIDDVPTLLEQSYRLRYQVYCMERRFLQGDEYPDRIETDVLDHGSVHVGALDFRGHVVGTARLIRPCDGRLPTLDHCHTFPPFPEIWGSTTRVIEVSRLCVSRLYSVTPVAARVGMQSTGGPVTRAHHDRAHVFFALAKGTYQASKRVRATHWLVAMERSLERFLTRNGFPFRQLGPEFEYLGAVAPYLMDLRDLDRVILSGRYPGLADLTMGLEPAFIPWVRDSVDMTFAGDPRVMDRQPPPFGVRGMARLDA